MFKVDVSIILDLVIIFCISLTYFEGLHKLGYGMLFYFREGRKELFYLTTYSTHLFMFIWHWTYGKDF